MTTQLTCPSCGTAIEITEALVAQVQQQIRSELEKEHAAALTKLQQETAAKIKKELLEQNSLETADLKKQLQEKNIKVEQMMAEELKLREKTRKLEEKEKEMDLELARRIDMERKKVEEAVAKQMMEEHRLKDLEKEKQIADMEKLVEELKRKAQQGSQQLQGEVQELDLESTLKELFPNDLIEPVGKGIRGADISHTIKSPRGIVCGVILWESKRTKAWSSEWTVKLKDDLRASKAHIPVIVSSVLPPDASAGIGLCDGVWVTSYSLVPAVAALLRKNLLDVAFQKAVFAHQGEKADLLYDYITGHEFRQQVEAIVEVYQEMQQQIVKEKIAFEKSWKAREGQLLRMIRSTANIYGSMQGVIGGSLPQLKGLELDGEEIGGDGQTKLL